MQTNPPIPGPLGLSELLDRTFRLVRLHFGQLTLIAAIFMVPYAILSGVLTGSAMTGYIDFIENTLTNPAIVSGDSPEELLTTTIGSLSGIFGTLLLIGLVGMVFQGAATLALTHHHFKTLQQEAGSVADSIKGGTRRLPAYMGMMIVEGLVILGLVLLMLLLFGCAVGVLVAGMGNTTGLFNGAAPLDGNVAGIAGFVILLVCLYVVALLILMVPIVYFAFRWMVAAPSLLHEELGPIAALRRSWRLSKGQIWRTVGYGILLYILGMVIVSAPAYILQQIAALTLGVENVGAAAGIASGVSALFSIVWQPFFVGALVLFYYDLRIRKEGYDLELRIQQMEADAE